MFNVMIVIGYSNNLYRNVSAFIDFKNYENFSRCHVVIFKDYEPNVW